PQAVLPLPVVGGSAQFQTSQVAVERKWIDTEPSPVCLSVRVGGDVGRAVERLANDRLGQAGIIAGPVGYPYRIVRVLPKLAPLIRPAQLHTDIGRRNQGRGPIGQRRCDKAVDPEWSLGFVKVAEGL